MRRVICISKGCRENYLEGVRIEDYFARNGWEPTDDPAAADCIVINSCGFTEEFEGHSLQTLSEMLRRKRSDAQVLFTGCLAAIHPEAVRRIGFDGPIISPRSLNELDSIIEARVPQKEVALPFIPSEDT
jgi:tRNA A37 methylthiotransferase MiaB